MRPCRVLLPLLLALAVGQVQVSAGERLRIPTARGLTLESYSQKITKASRQEHRVEKSLVSRPIAAWNVRGSLEDLHHATGWVYGATWQQRRQDADWLLAVTRADRDRRRTARAAAERRGRLALQRKIDDTRAQLGLIPGKQSSSQRASFYHPRASNLSKLVLSLPAPIWNRFGQTGSAQVRMRDLPPRLQQFGQASKMVGSSRLFYGDRFGRRIEAKPKGPDDGWLRIMMGGSLESPTILARFDHSGGAFAGNILDEIGVFREAPEERRKRRKKSRRPEDSRFSMLVTLRDHPRPRALERGERPPNAKPPAVHLSDLARQVKMPIIAECEYKQGNAAWLREQWWLGADIVRLPLTEALDLICSDFELEWSFESGILRLRPRDWYLEPAERGYRFRSQKEWSALRLPGAPPPPARPPRP